VAILVTHTLPEMGKLKWQCRRGVLELDMLLERFLSEQYADLSAEDKAAFVMLLEQTDEELLSWFFGDGMPGSESLKRIVIKLKA
jgi:antitoxin CptB